jgi:hypothetical protein
MTSAYQSTAEKTRAVNSCRVLHCELAILRDPKDWRYRVKLRNHNATIRQAAREFYQSRSRWFRDPQASEEKFRRAHVQHGESAGRSCATHSVASIPHCANEYRGDNRQFATANTIKFLCGRLAALFQIWTKHSATRKHQLGVAIFGVAMS